jgi:hypothetical protein
MKRIFYYLYIKKLARKFLLELMLKGQKINKL